MIPNALKRYNVTRASRASLICERFRKLAPSVIGDKALEHIKPKCFKNGILYISVPNSMWAQQVHVHRHDLIMKLNLNLEKDWVHDMRTHVGKVTVDELGF